MAIVGYGARQLLGWLEDSCPGGVGNISADGNPIRLKDYDARRSRIKLKRRKEPGSKLGFSLSLRVSCKLTTDAFLIIFKR